MAARKSGNKNKKKAPIKSWNRMKIGLILSSTVIVLSAYYLFLASNVSIRSGSCYFHVPHNATPNTVYHLLKDKQILKHNATLRLALLFFKFPKIRQGLYKFEKGWGNWKILHELKFAKVKPFKIFEVPIHRKRSNVIISTCKSAGVDIKEFSSLLNDSVFIKGMGRRFSIESVYCIFLPGQYEIYSPCTAQELMECICAGYDLFWTDNRREEAQELSLSPEEATILASIVYAETKNKEEMPIVAGLYLNRLKKKMRLEADPTLVYATGNYNTRRVYRKYTEHISRYNTYRYKGLPPGPIGPVSKEAIEAVLHPATHNYLFFCAREDRSGCHVFSENFEEHKKNADRYRKMLNRNNVR